MTTLIMFGLTLLILLAVFALMGIKVILKPGSEFKKSCGDLSGEGCSHCGRPAGEFCDDHGKGTCDE